ncbi:MAG: hypothetical protein LBG81_05730 [Coriobacteriaceae bacterium]|jgi:hypothetical protein|nr:hypothetical protein [Coriobacteriaceae bacterium]
MLEGYFECRRCRHRRGLRCLAWGTACLRVQRENLSRGMRACDQPVGDVLAWGDLTMKRRKRRDDRNEGR